MFDKDSWNTPPEILERVRRIGPIGCDPCSNPTSLVNATEEYRLDRGEDGLALEWLTRDIVFVNCPYSRGNFLKWAEKIAAEATKHAEIVALVPSNVETKAWQRHLWNAQEICFPAKRIRFLVHGKPKGTPKQGSGICYFGHRVEAFRAAFEGFGRFARG